ncbi:MAG: ribosome maturation factor RimM [Gammaproteobacteria bacterium]
MSIPSLDELGKLVVLGRLGKSHGVKGWIRLNSYTNPPENILHYPELRVAAGDGWQALQIDASRPHLQGLLVHIDGFDSPEAVAALSGLELFVDSGSLPGLDNGDYYWHQLQGLRVVNLDGDLYGVVDRLMETGANDVLVVKPLAESIDDRERLVPYVKDRIVREVNLADKLIRVDWDADFLE